MANETENLDSLNQEKAIEGFDYEASDDDARKEHFTKLSDQNKRLLDLNRQLFERAKKAETDFKELRDNPPKPKKSEKPEPSDDKLLEKLDKITLRAADITADDEVELAFGFKTRTGLEMDQILNDDIFQAKLEKLRTTKANAAATDKVKGDAGAASSGAKNTPQYWIDKMTRGPDGQPMFPEDLPNDRKLRAAIVEEITKKSDLTGGKKFYNE